MGRFTAAKTTLIWFVVLTNRWECGDLRSHIGCSSGLVCNENGDKRRASKYLRRVLERFFGASISLPTKTSWCQATVVALLWSAMQITVDDASRELGRAVTRLRPSGCSSEPPGEFAI